jgi:hypothetical protein
VETAAWEDGELQTTLILTEQRAGIIFGSLYRFSVLKPPLGSPMHSSVVTIRVRHGADGFTILEAGLVVNQDQAIAFKAVAIDQ